MYITVAAYEKKQAQQTEVEGSELDTITSALQGATSPDEETF